MKRTGIACLISSMFGMGCAVGAPELEEEEPIGVSQQAEIASNSLTVNSLTVNSLTVNSLTVNSLTVNSLSFASLPSNIQGYLTDPGPTGDLNREFMRYAISCAFEIGQSFDFMWTDADSNLHNEHFVGSIGLAPEWGEVNGSLNLSAQRWVSACMAARTNYYGIPVTISIRGSNDALSVADSELTGYRNLEGAFWGNLFDGSPALSACYFGDNIQTSQDAQRICATGLTQGTVQLSCGIIDIVGECDSICTRPEQDANAAYTSCSEDTYLVTTFLP